MNPSTLVVDGDPPTRERMRDALESEGHRVHEAATGALALEQAALLRPESVVLDLALPDLPGLDVLRELREWSLAPVLVLCSGQTESEKERILDAGADDFLDKPFGAAELLTRFRAAVRRSRAVPDDALVMRGDLTIDPATRRVTRAGSELKLTPTEYALVQMLVRHPGRVLTHRQILGKIWGLKANGERPYLPVYITHLRAKIERDPAHPQLIQTEPGIGYRFATE